MLVFLQMYDKTDIGLVHNTQILSSKIGSIFVDAFFHSLMLSRGYSSSLMNWSNSFKFQIIEKVVFFQSYLLESFSSIYWQRLKTTLRLICSHIFLLKLRGRARHWFLFDFSALWSSLTLIWNKTDTHLRKGRTKLKLQRKRKLFLSSSRNVNINDNIIWY